MSHLFANPSLLRISVPTLTIHPSIPLNPFPMSPRREWTFTDATLALLSSHVGLLFKGTDPLTDSERFSGNTSVAHSIAPSSGDRQCRFMYFTEPAPVEGKTHAAVYVSKSQRTVRIPCKNVANLHRDAVLVPLQTRIILAFASMPNNMVQFSVAVTTAVKYNRKILRAEAYKRALNPETATVITALKFDGVMDSLRETVVVVK